MRIIKPRTLIEFYEENENSKVALQEWIDKAKRAEWENFSEMKNTFNSVDSVGNRRYVFNIKGNHYRLIAIVLFVPKTILIRFIGTHTDYDKIKDCSII